MQNYLYDAKNIILKDRCRKISTYINLQESDIQTVDDMQIYVTDGGEYLHNYNTIIAGLAILDNGMNAILVDDIFRDAPAYVQKFFLLHEIGHYKNGDMNRNMVKVKNRNKRLLGFREYIKSEYSADEYAAKNIGYSWAYESLSWVLCNIRLPLICKLEIMRRKNKIKKQCIVVEW